MVETEIKPCPFCRSCTVRMMGGGILCYVQCGFCYAEGPTIKASEHPDYFNLLPGDRYKAVDWAENQAIKMWNEACVPTEGGNSRFKALEQDQKILYGKISILEDTLRCAEKNSLEITRLLKERNEENTKLRLTLNKTESKVGDLEKEIVNLKQVIYRLTPDAAQVIIQASEHIRMW